MEKRPEVLDLMLMLARIGGHFTLEVKGVCIASTLRKAQRTSEMTVVVSLSKAKIAR